MAFDATDIVLSIIKIAFVLAMMLQITPIMAWVERRGSALIQDRPGPNRVGPLGLFQSLADAAKFILKEDIIPAQAHKWLYTLAPAFGLLPALTTIAVVPWGRPFILHETTMFGRTIFQGVPSPFEATRYHSLIVEDAGFPDALEVTARTKKGEIMGLRHRQLAVEGVQFHPESILTDHGLRLIENWLGSL